MLNTILYEPAVETHLTPLLIVHGLFGSARNWGVIAKRLSDTRRVVSVDMRNHGDSPRFDDHTYAGMAADLAEVIRAHGGRMHVLGHSMGGKAAMMLALTAPELVDHLIVADIAPVAYGHSQNHLIDAMRSLDIGAIKSRGEADAGLKNVILDAGVRAFLLQSLDYKAGKWLLNLDVLYKDMELITGWPAGDLAADARFDGPAFFLSGADSTYVMPDARPEIKRLFSGAKFAKIPDTGHWLHAEKPRDFEASVRVFLGSR